MKAVQAENVITVEHDDGRKDVTILAPSITAFVEFTPPGGGDESQ